MTRFICEKGHPVRRFAAPGAAVHRLLCPECDADEVARVLAELVPQPVVIDGRPGTIVYLAADGRVVADPEQAVRARVVFEDGGSMLLVVNEGAEP
jgi:hypothetical protein